MKDEARITPQQGFDLTAWVAADMQARLVKDVAVVEEAASDITSKNGTSDATPTDTSMGAGMVKGGSGSGSGSSGGGSSNKGFHSASGTDIKQQDDVVGVDSGSGGGSSKGSGSNSSETSDLEQALSPDMPAVGRRLSQVSFTAPNQSATIQRLPTAYVFRFGNTFDLLGTGQRFLAKLFSKFGTLVIFGPRQITTFLQGLASDFCSPELLSSSSRVLGKYVLPSITLSLTPSKCPVVEDPVTGLRSVNFEACTSSTLSIAITPTIFTGPYTTGVLYMGPYCRYERYLGTDQSAEFGGGNTGFTVNRATQGIKIIPNVRNFQLKGPLPTVGSAITVLGSNGVVSDRTSRLAPPPSHTG
ncbi:MAG: hypothetical protein WDW38_006717 [Sanguina aurantia]